MKMLFLDIDGVLNDHRKHANRWSPILPTLVARLNTILVMVPDLQIVLSSAWRYRFDTAWYVEALLCVHGVHAFERVHGVTAFDPCPEDRRPYEDKEWWDRMGLLWRADQINAYVEEHRPDRWVAVDDLPIQVQHIVQTDPLVGLTDADVDAVVARLMEPVAA